MPTARLKRHAHRLFQAIEQRTTRGHPCHGRYVLTVLGAPHVPRPKSNQGRAVIAAALRYIGVTGLADSQVAATLLRDAGGELQITKQARHCGSVLLLRIQPFADSTQGLSIEPACHT